MLKRSIFTTSHLQTFSYPLEKKLAVDLDADVKIRLWKGCMFCLCHRVMEKAQCALEWQDSARPGVEGCATMPCGTQAGRFRQPSPGTLWGNGPSKPWSIV